MKVIRAERKPYTIILQINNSADVYPYLRSAEKTKKMYCVSPCHGRSYVVGRKSDGRYVISKGNGLSYSQYNFLYTGEFGDNTWGLLLIQDAKRDFIVGREVEQLGIKTNFMEYVLQLKDEIMLSDGHIIKPVLLQYSVECPYRICDAPFYKYDVIKNEVNKWEKYNEKGFDEAHLIAADVLAKNLAILHSNNILHNAINIQNYTWALELLDFELACSPSYPYDKEDDNRYIKDYFSREIMHTYEIINYIAYYLDEPIDYNEIDNIFKSYGFDLFLLEK